MCSSLPAESKKNYNQPLHGHLLLHLSRISDGLPASRCHKKPKGMAFLNFPIRLAALDICLPNKKSRMQAIGSKEFLLKFFVVFESCVPMFNALFIVVRPIQKGASQWSLNSKSKPSKFKVAVSSIPNPAMAFWFSNSRFAFWLGCSPQIFKFG